MVVDTLVVDGAGRLTIGTADNPVADGVTADIVIANNGAHLAKLVNEHGVKLREFGEDIYDGFGEAANAVFEETRSHSALAAKILDEFQAALKEVGGWQKIAEVAFSVQRNRVLGI